MSRRHSLVDPAQWLEQWVSRCRVGDPIACAGKGSKAHLDQLVTAVADRDLRGRQLKAHGDRLPRRLRGWARIEAKRVRPGRPDRLDQLRGGRNGRLVGVELDPTLAVGRLLARGVSLIPLERPPYDAFRHSSKKVSKARRGLTACSQEPRVP